MNRIANRRSNIAYRRIILGAFIVLSSSMCDVRFRLAFAAQSAYYDYLRGMLEERAGNLNKAIVSYEKAVQQDPEAIEVFRALAQVNLRLGQAEPALRAAERARDLAPQDPSSLIFLGNVFVAQGNLAKAADSYQQALALDPKNLRALENLGNYYAMVDPEKSLDYYQRYLDIDPNDPEMIFQIGMAQHKVGKVDKAISSFEKSISYDPRQVAPYLALAEIYDARKSTAAAISSFEKAAELQPGHPLIHSRLAHLYYSQKRLDEAYAQFELARQAQPKDPSLSYWLARISEDQEKWGQAASHAKTAYDIAKDPQFLPLLAYYLTLDRRPADALPWLEKAKAATPQNANVYLFLGLNYLESGKTEKAVDALKKGVALAPTDSQILFQLGVARDRQGKFEEAVKQFESVLAVDPENTAAMNYLGYSWAERNVRLEEAEKLLRKAIEKEPENGAFLDSIGWIRYKQGAYSDAVTFLEKASQQSEDVLIFDHLGDALLADGKIAKAVDAWRNALRLEPNSPVIEKKLRDAASLVGPGLDTRKLLKRVEGNLRQISDLRSRLSVDAKLKKQPIKLKGLFFYRSPDDLVMHMPGHSNFPDIRLRIRGQEVRIEPAEYAQSIAPQALDGLQSLPGLFSGTLVLPLDQADVKIQMDKELVRYRGGGADEAWIDPTRGVFTRVIRKNPHGGKDEIDFDEYLLIEGLWLPTRVRVRNKVKGLDARMRFSDWVVNNPENQLPFK